MRYFSAVSSRLKGVKKYYVSVIGYSIAGFHFLQSFLDFREGNYSSSLDCFGRGTLIAAGTTAYTLKKWSDKRKKPKKRIFKEKEMVTENWGDNPPEIVIFKNGKEIVY